MHFITVVAIVLTNITSFSFTVAAATKVCSCARWCWWCKVRVGSFPLFELSTGAVSLSADGIFAAAGPAFVGKKTVGVVIPLMSRVPFNVGEVDGVFR